MAPALVAFSCSVLPLAAQDPSTALSVEKIFAHGPIIGTPPAGQTWSPDSKHLTYLEGGELVELDLGSGSSHVLVSRAKLAALEGNAGSEQDRDRRKRYKMASYLWSPDSKHLVFDSYGRLWFYDLRTGTGVQIGFTGAASGDDPKFSPDGDYLSFVRDRGLDVIRIKEGGSNPTVVASSTGPSVLNGQVDWVYEEELDVRSNYFWSPDSKLIAYLQTNEGEVPEYPITDWIPTHAQGDNQHYPQPGDANPDVRVGVVGAQGGKTVWVKLPIRAGQDYIPRFGWTDRRTLWIETLSRDQKHRILYFADVGNGQSHEVLNLSDEKFLDENYDVFVDSGYIVLSAWNDGHNHIYLYSYEGPRPLAAKLERQLTTGDYDVAAVSTVDFGQKVVNYASSEGNPLEQQLWQVSFGGERRKLTDEAGFHEGNFSSQGSVFVDKFSRRMEPPRLSLCQTGGKCNVFWSTRAQERYKLRAPEQIEVKAQDGSTLYGTLLLPTGPTNPASVPLIVNPYGGPAPPEVVNQWSDSLFFDELLAQHGFAVLHADNRGTGMRGRAFAQAAYHDFGPVQLEDQLTVIDAMLAEYPQLDPKRLGWWGWSWGGTFTLYAMTHSDRFRAGVAVAPVTDWRDYDSIYTERYLSLPTEFASGYKDFSVVNSAASLKGHLLLVHGTGDDNVHFENTVQFVQKLIEADLPYDLQIYPRKTHSIAGSDARTHLFNRILAHFEQNLKPPVL